MSACDDVQARASESDARAMGPSGRRVTDGAASRARRCAVVACALVAVALAPGALGAPMATVFAIESAASPSWLNTRTVDASRAMDVNARELAVIARHAIGLTSPSARAGANDARDDVLRDVLSAGAGERATRRGKVVVFSVDRAVDVAARDNESGSVRTRSMAVSSTSRVSLAAVMGEIARGGRCDDVEAEALFNRKECFEEVERSGDARARARAYVKRELACFEEGLRAFVRKDGEEAARVAYVALEGVTYASRKFGSKSDVALDSARLTADVIKRVLDTIAVEYAATAPLAAIALPDNGVERASTTSERRLLGFDGRALTADDDGDNSLSTSVGENDEDAVAEFRRRAVQWAVTVIIVAAALGGVLALLGMPIQEDPLLYAPIPGTKLD